MDNESTPKAVGENVLIDPKEDKPRNGVIVPDSAKEQPKIGTVISVGSKVDEIKPGDVVFFEHWYGKEYKRDGKTYIVVEQSHILVKESEVEVTMGIDLRKK